MLLCNLSPATSRAIKKNRRERHPSPQDNGVASLLRSSLNAESPSADSKPVYLHQASDYSSMECHPQIERSKAGSRRRSRIIARIERCRLIQRFFRRTPHKEEVLIDAYRPDWQCKLMTPRSCVSCLESMPADELVSLPCQHKYCSTCIRQMVATNMADEQLFPPRCCSRKIPSETILPLLPPKERESFVSKTTEYATPVADRWYCPAPTCGKWIPPTAVKAEKSQTQTCLYCSTRICSKCRGVSHRSGDCSSDAGLSAVLEVARLQRWQRCFNCGAVVELIFGCDHITCRCSAQFCYKCGKQWSSCVCVTPAERPVDFFAFVIDGNALNRDEEAGLTAVLATMLCHEREAEDPLTDKGNKGTQSCRAEGCWVRGRNISKVDLGL